MCVIEPVVVGERMASTQLPHKQLKETFFFSFTFHQYLFCFLLMVIVVLKLARRAKIKQTLNLPPSPRKLPIIGNLHQIAGTIPYHTFRALSHKHGDLMWLQLGQTQALVVSSAAVAREIMKHDLIFANRFQSAAAKTLLYGCNDIGFVSYGESWKEKRKICVLELLSSKRVQSFRPIREEEVAELVNRISEASSMGACTVNLTELVTEAANNIICKCSLGQHHTKEFYSRFNKLARKAMIQLAVVTVGDFFPLLSWVDVLTGRIQEIKATSGALDALFDEVIAVHKSVKREAEHPSCEKNFVDILIQLQENGMPNFDLEELTNNDIKSILLDMFAAGSETTLSTIEWAIAELMKSPTKMKKAQEEVRRFVGYKSKIEENDINQMNYMKCVIKETLRLHPPAPLLIPRETSSSVKLKEYDIPAKTVVYINSWAIHRDPEFWERPEEFLPERHYDIQVPFKGQDLQFLPFGFGRRGCPGMTFGIVSVEYMLANLLYWFNWELPTTGQDIDLSETYGLVTSKKVPLHLKPIPFSFESNF